MKFRIVTAPVLLLAATGAIAADLLPLKRGIYVTAGVSCKGASNADTLSYWGRNNGINDQQAECKINTLKKDGSTYFLNRTCKSIRFGGASNDQVKVIIINSTSFTLKSLAFPAATPSIVRYCGPKAQF